MRRRSSAFLTGSLFLLIGCQVGNVCNYLFQFYMSRNLSLEDYGALNSLLSFMIITAIPATSVLLVTAKLVSQYKVREAWSDIQSLQKQLWVKVNFFCMGMLILFVGLSPFIAGFLHLESYLPLFLLYGLIYLSFLIPINFGVIQGLQRFIVFSLLTSLMGILKLGFGVLFLKWNLALTGSVASLSMSTAGALLLSFFFLKIPPGEKSGDPIRIRTRDIVCHSTPVVIASMGIMFLTTADMLFIKHFIDPEQAGLYASVSVLGRTIFYFPGILVMALFPIAAEKHARRTETTSLLRQAYGLTALLAGIGVILLVFWPEFFLSLLFGNTFSKGAHLLPLFAGAMFFMALTNTIVTYNLAKERTGFLWILVFCIILEIVLVSLFHITIMEILYCVFFVTALSQALLLADIRWGIMERWAKPGSLLIRLTSLLHS